MDPEYEKSLTTPSPDGPPFRPAKGLLICMGFIVIFGGFILCALGWLYGVKMPELELLPDEKPPLGESIKGAFESVGVMLAAIGLGLAVLGGGSIAIRKWARDLLLASGWLLIAFALLLVLSLILMIPQMMAMSEEMAQIAGGTGTAPIPSMSWMMMIGIVIGSVFYLLLIGGPGALLVVIYQRKNVELTTRYYHQAPSWTEKRHTSVLALWLLYALGIIGLLSMSFGFIPLAVEMKILPSEQVGWILLAVGLVAMSVLAFGVSRAATWSWWASLAYAFLGAGLGYCFYHFGDWEIMSRQMWPELEEGDVALAELMQQQQTASQKASLYSGILTWIAWLAYLFWIRKYFGTTTPGLKQPS